MPYTPTPTKTLREHADALAGALQVMAPDAPELAAYKAATAEEWVKGPELCKRLGIGRRTLVRWRQNGTLTPTTEWRTLPMTNGHCVYNVAAVQLKMGTRQVGES